MILFAGLLETSVFKQEPGRGAGDFRAGGVLGVPNGSTLPDGEAKARKLNAELANGRLAMMAIIGMFFQDGLTGAAWGDWELYADSPLRAGGGDAAAASAFDPASMPGATEPLGFWDPVGFCNDKNEENFMKLRGAELKHGRVAMLANAGFLLQPFLKFKELDVKDGALALDYTSDSAILGCAFLFVGLFELRILPALEGEPGNFGDPFKISSGSALNYDQTQAKNVELNNGRFAMIGAIGAITANLYTGMGTYEQWGAAKGVAIDYIKTTIWWAA